MTCWLRWYGQNRTRCRIQWRTFGRIPWHVIPQPLATLQGAATWWIHCHDSRVTCHIARCSHLAKSMSWSCHIAGCNIPSAILKIVFSPYYIFFCFFYADWALTSGGFCIVSDTLVLMTCCTTETETVSRMQRDWPFDCSHQSVASPSLCLCQGSRWAFLAHFVLFMVQCIELMLKKLNLGLYCLPVL